MDTRATIVPLQNTGWSVGRQIRWVGDREEANASMRDITSEPAADGPTQEATQRKKAEDWHSLSAREN